MTDQELRLECLRLVKEAGFDVVSMSVNANLLFQYAQTGEPVTQENYYKAWQKPEFCHQEKQPN